MRTDKTAGCKPIETMPKKDNARKEGAQTRIEQLVDILLREKDIPEKSVEKLHEWIADPEKREKKSEALSKFFNEDFNYSESKVYAREMWPKVARRLGFEEELLENVILRSETAPLIAQPRRHTLRRRVAIRVAAVLIPTLVVVGTWGVLNYQAGQIITASTAAGETKEITLPDGSKVTLFDGSDIAYERKFKTGRNVELAGHALFNIVKETTAEGERTPFTVSANDIRVNVLGTVFRMEERDCSDKSYVALYQGSVSVENGGTTELRHGELFTYDKTTKKNTITLLPARDMADNGYKPLLRFEDSSLGNLVTALEANYGVKCVIAEGIDLARGRFSGDLEELPAEVAVDLLTKSNTTYSFTLTGDSITVTRK